VVLCVTTFCIHGFTSDKNLLLCFGTRSSGLNSKQGSIPIKRIETQSAELSKHQNQESDVPRVITGLLVRATIATASGLSTLALIYFCLKRVLANERAQVVTGASSLASWPLCVTVLLTSFSSEYYVPVGSP